MLVAIAIMATMAFMSWRALAGMSQAEALTHARADDLLAIQAGLGQWTADLDALADTGHTPALDFDGRTLRLTRRDALEGDHHSPGVQVVAWSLQQGQWGAGRWRGCAAARRCRWRGSRPHAGASARWMKTSANRWTWRGPRGGRCFTTAARPGPTPCRPTRPRCPMACAWCSICHPAKP
ncbi:MAG: hypothetical protein U1D28_13990 [Burkholderiales bacterium]|nr:hypothetical protein [Burkholderiales bacterium]